MCQRIARSLQGLLRLQGLDVVAKPCGPQAPQAWPSIRFETGDGLAVYPVQVLLVTDTTAVLAHEPVEGGRVVTTTLGRGKPQSDMVGLADALAQVMTRHRATPRTHD